MRVSGSVRGVSFQPAKHSFTIWAGATFNPTVTAFKDEAGTQLRDLTGYAASFEVKDVAFGNTLMYLSDEDGITIGGVAGTITVTIGPEVTAGLGWDSGVYQLLLTNPQLQTDALLWGPIAVRGI